MRQRTLTQIAEAITENAKRYDDGTVEYVVFDETARRLWDEVTRGEVNAIGTPCNRRMRKVTRIVLES